MNLPSLGGNYIDLIIFIILFYFIYEAFRVGFWVIVVDFLSFLISLTVSLWGYKYLSDLLRSNFSLSHSLSNAIGFLLIASLSEGLLGIFLWDLIKKLPFKFWKKKILKFFAIFPALGEGLILVSFILTLVLALPIYPKIKTDIVSSKVGGLLVRNTTNFESLVNEIFGGVIEDSLTYLTVRPQSSETIPLETASSNLSVDHSAEKKMFELVNEERGRLGLDSLSLNERLSLVARSHAKDMWERRYFSHYSPDGDDVGDRLEDEGVLFLLAGENLALAPTTQTAHIGLMNSQGHRENILEANFKKVGIGVIDNEIYGKMFVQVFTD